MGLNSIGIEDKVSIQALKFYFISVPSANLNVRPMEAS